MELDISELPNSEFDNSEFESNYLDYDYNFDNFSVKNYVEEENPYLNNNNDFEQIPENFFPKKKVQFNEPIKPMNQSIPRINAKMVRQQVIPPKPQISYDDILQKMGMYVVNGKLHLLEDKKQLKSNKSVNYNNSNKPTNYNIDPNINQNNYIYNKYFREHIQTAPNVKRPMTLMEYRTKLIKDILQKRRINQIKSTKLLFSTSNINISGGSLNSGNINKLFNFSTK
jgi:hypothetical protein